MRLRVRFIVTFLREIGDQLFGGPDASVNRGTRGGGGGRRGQAEESKARNGKVKLALDPITTRPAARVVRPRSRSVFSLSFARQTHKV